MRLLGREQPASRGSSGTCGVMANYTRSITRTLPALIDQRVQHSELFQDSNISTVAHFLQQDAGQLAAVLRVCHDHCAELDGCCSSRD
jgi:hypothetical protein